MGKVLIYGGSGQLGRSVVNEMLGKGWHVVSVDYVANGGDHVQDVVLTAGAEPAIAASQVRAAVQGPVDAVVCVAGGWGGGSVADESVFSSTAAMLACNAWTALTAAHVAAHVLAPNGLLVLTGAASAVGPTAGCIGYGMAKAATHQLVQSLAASNSGLPAGSTVAAICPMTLDTPANRAGMPNADFSSWTPLSFVAGLISSWALHPDSRPTSGSLLALTTVKGETQLSPLKN